MSRIRKNVYRVGDNVITHGGSIGTVVALEEESQRVIIKMVGTTDRRRYAYTQDELKLIEGGPAVKMLGHTVNLRIAANGRFYQASTADGYYLCAIPVGTSIEQSYTLVFEALRTVLRAIEKEGF